MTDLGSWNDMATRAAIEEFDFIAGAEDALAQGFTTISVEDDWATVFA